MIVGVAVGGYLVTDSNVVGEMFMDTVIAYSAYLRWMINWIMNYPAGLKLNTELAVFLGELFLFLIDLYDGKKIITIYRC